MGFLYSNIRFWSKLTSPNILKGEQEVIRAKQLGDDVLLTDINNAARAAGVVPIITTITEGKHADNSRHYTGQAVDIASFEGIGGRGSSGFKLAGDKLCAALESLGYFKNIEIGKDKAVLWQTRGHHGHLHVSNKTGKASDKQASSDFSSLNSAEYQLGETLDIEPTGLKYFHFDPDFIERGIRLYKEYYNKTDIEDNKNNRGSGDIGFVPLTLNMKLDGISGWVIYDKLRIDQKILPPQYPKNFNFVIMGVSHTIEGNDWVTNIETLSVPDLEPKVWEQDVNLTIQPVPANIPGDGGYYNFSNLPPNKIRQIFANVENSGNTDFSKTHNGGSTATGPYGWLLSKGAHLYDMWYRNMGSVQNQYKDWEDLKKAATSGGSGSLDVEKYYQYYLSKMAGNDIKAQLAYNLGGNVGLREYKNGNLNYHPGGKNMNIGEYINKALK